MLISNNNRQVPWWNCYALLLLVFWHTTSKADNYKGFNFIDDRIESVIPFDFVDNLIVVPVKINDNMEVNLILDTGGRSVILFGDHFDKKLDVMDNEIRLNGYGRNRNKTARLSLNNKVQLGEALGQGISVLVANGRYFFPYNGKVKIHGIIGYQVFCRFVVSIDYQNGKLTLTEPKYYIPPEGYAEMELALKDTKPYIRLGYKAYGDQAKSGYFHIDTGSSRDVLLFLKSADSSLSKKFGKVSVGKGINGPISGYKSAQDQMILAGLDAVAGYYLVEREFSRREIQNAQGSIGSGLLKKFNVVLDYVNQKFYYQRVVT